MAAVIEPGSEPPVIGQASLLREVDGAIRVAGTRVTLDTVVGAYLDGANAEDIALAYDALELADIHETIAYYLRHRSEVDAYLRRREEEAAEVRRINELRWPASGIRERLLHATLTSNPTLA